MASNEACTSRRTRRTRTKILITAGPTWIPIDAVRFIGNLASGETGILFAKEALRRGAAVTLLLGPVTGEPQRPLGTVIRYRYFDELRRAFMGQLRSQQYDCIIHTAAVADYRPARVLRGKLSSSRQRLMLPLVPTPKLIDTVRRLAPCAFVVAFKYEPVATKHCLVAEALALRRRAQCDVVVANTASRNAYRAYAVTNASTHGPYRTKGAMVKNVLTLAGIR